MLTTNNGVNLYFFQCHGHKDVPKTSEKSEDKSDSRMELRDRECCFNSVTKPLLIRDLPELEPKQTTEIKITKKVTLSSNKMRPNRVK